MKNNWRKNLWCVVVTAMILVPLWGHGSRVKAAEAGSLEINEQNFPADWLRTVLKTKYYDINGDGVLSQEEIKQINIVENFVEQGSEIVTPKQALVATYIGDETIVKIISGDDLWEKDTIDVRGIEHLTSCTILSLAKVKGKTLKIEGCPKSLNNIWLSASEINRIEVAGNNITEFSLYAYDSWRSEEDSLICRVNELDVSQCKNLEWLVCDSPTLATVDVSQNKNLERLSCNGNKMTSLNVSYNKNLNYLECDKNQLETLDLSNNNKLYTLSAQDNKLKNIKLAKNLLRVVNVKDNQLTSFATELCPNIRTLNVKNNHIKKLDLTKCKELEVLSCKQNQLRTLDLSNNTELRWVSCRQNKIRTLKLPNVNFTDSNNSMDEDFDEINESDSLFGENPTDILDLSKIKNFKKISRKTVKEFINGKFHRSPYFEEKKVGSRKIKKLIISTKLSESDRIWLMKKAQKYKVKVSVK